MEKNFLKDSFYNRLIAIILISGLGAIVYANTFFAPFQFDDIFFIVNNLSIRSFQHWLNIWEFYPCRFVTFLTLALNYHWHKLDVLGYHIFNLAVHLGSAFFVWWLTLLTLSTPAMKEKNMARHANLIALMAGLVFVSHPLQTEAVTYIWQRVASMATLFYLASLSLYVKSRLLYAGPLQRYYYFASLIAAVLAMFTKEMAITLPLMILLYEFSFLKTKKSLNWKYLIPFLLTLLIIPLTVMLLPKSVRAQEMEGVISGFKAISPMHYLLTQLRVMVTYIRLVFLPLNQNLDYDYAISQSIFEWPVLLSFFFLIVILYSAKRLFSKYRLVSFSIFWFFLTLLPESSVIPLKDVIFEHRLYLPMAGYSIFLVSGMYYLLGKNTIPIMVIALTMIIACNSFLTYQRNKIWRDEIALWDDTVKKSPHKARPYYGCGLCNWDHGHFALAISDFSKVIEIDPYQVDAYNTRGTAWEKQGHFTQALSDYNKAILLEPYYPKAYLNRGGVYAKQGQVTQAMSDYNQAITLDPKLTEVYNNRAGFYYGQGLFRQALSDYNKAIDLNPENATYYSNRAYADIQLKEFDKAWGDVRKAQELGGSVAPEFINALKKISGSHE